MLSRGLTKNTIIFLGDFLLFFLALYITLAIRNWDRLEGAFYEHLIPFFILFFIYQIILFSAGLWDKRFIPSKKRIFDSLVPVQIVATIIISLFFYAMPVFYIAPKTNLLLFSIILFIFIFFWKYLALKSLHSKPEKAVIIGNSFKVENFFPKDNLWNLSIAKKLPLKSNYKTIKSFLEKNKINTVVVDVEMYPRTDILYKLFFEDINILDIKDIKEEIDEKIDISRVDQLWFIQNIKSNRGIFTKMLKRFFDIFLAIPVFLIFIILYPPLAYFIKKEDGGKVLISLPRIGKGNHPFILKKFRSMPENILAGKKEITKIGAFLRKTSFDELPQVLAVLKGDMSFVGPRPETPDYVKKYSKTIPFYNVRHLVLPGITGWAQIKQKQAPHHKADTKLTKEKLAYDLYYIKKHSLFLYVKISLQTIKILFTRTNYDK